MNRRDFLGRAAAVAAASVPGRAAAGAAGPEWAVGCFNRPWAKWPFDQALKGVKAAGYPTIGLLSRTKDEPFIGASEYMAKKIPGAHLEVIPNAGHAANLDNPDDFNRVLRGFLDSLPA